MRMTELEVRELELCVFMIGPVIPIDKLMAK